jgi:hypothetical protein
LRDLEIGQGHVDLVAVQIDEEQHAVARPGVQDLGQVQLAGGDQGYLIEIAAWLGRPERGSGQPGLVGHARRRGRETGIGCAYRPHDHPGIDVDQGHCPDALERHDLIE